MKNIIAFDTETTGLNIYKGARPFCISFTDKDMNNIYFRWTYEAHTREVFIDTETRTEIQNIFNLPNTVFIAHNIKFDLTMLESIGIYIDLDKIEVCDTVVLAHIENNARNTYKLKPLCNNLFNYPDTDEQDLKRSVSKNRILGKQFNWKLGAVLAEDYALGDLYLCEKYATGDTERCMLLYKYLMPLLNTKQLEILAMEMQLLRVLIAMEKKGITIDIEKAKELEGYYNDIITKGTQTKLELGYDTLNTRSPKQMQSVFYGEMDVDKAYKKNKLTVNKNALNQWSDTNPLAKAIVNINVAEHELGSFILPLQDLCDVNNRVHPNYNQVGATTGRISCTSPNLMNISNVKDGVKGEVKLRARELFVPQKGHVLYFPDYSQIEVWISAFCSKDEVMCKALLDGLDIHSMLSKKSYSHKDDYLDKKDIYRKKAKMGVFCILYGGGADQLSSTLGCTKTEAIDFITLFRDTYKDLAQYNKDLVYVAKEFGLIENVFGRVYNVHTDASYKALNYMIQGSASEVMKRALINIYSLLKVNDKYKDKGINLLLTIHDEVCIEALKELHSKELMQDIIKAMQGDLHTYFDMPKPFEVSMAYTETNWADKKECII